MEVMVVMEAKVAEAAAAAAAMVAAATAAAVWLLLWRRLLQRRHDVRQGGQRGSLLSWKKRAG